MTWRSPSRMAESQWLPWSRVLVAPPLLFAWWATCSRLWIWAQEASQWPRWDMAKYGAAASRLQQAIESWDLWALLAEIHQLDSWPFVVPLLEGLVFAVFGNEVAVARCLMVVFFAAMCCLGAYLAWQLGDCELESQLLVLWTVPLVLASPMLQLYAVLNMLEIPGAFFSLLALGLYWRVLEDPRRSGRWWAFGAACCLLFFCKYNYGLIWLLAVALTEMRRRNGSWRQAARRLRQALSYRPLGSWQIFVMVMIIGLVSLRLVGGLEIQVGGMKLRGTSIGNPVYGLLLLTVGRYLFLAGPRQKWRHSWRQAQPSTRVLGWSLGLPILLWMLVPPHCKNFFGFVENRSSDLDRWSLESWWFYGSSLEHEFLTWPALTWPLLLLALWGCCRLPRLSLHLQVLALWVSIHGAALVAHPYKLSRFAVTLFVPLLLLALRGGVEVLSRWKWPGAEGKKRHALVRGWQRLWWAGSLAMLVALLWTQDQALAQLEPAETITTMSSLQGRFSEQTVPAATGPLLDRILELASIDETTALLGTWNLLSPALVEWRQDQAMKGVQLWLGRSLERRLHEGDVPAQVLVLELLPEAWRSDLAEANRLETTPQREHWIALEASDELVKQPVEEWTMAGYRLHIYQRPSG